MKANFKSEDFKRGKSQTSKKRHRRIIKRGVENDLTKKEWKMLLDDIGVGGYDGGDFYKD